MKNVLLTGATGFVGRQILKSLLACNCDVTIVVRPGWQDRIPFALGDTTVIEVDNLFAVSTEWWAGVLGGIDTVIHSAWYAEPGKYLTSEKNIDCLIGTSQLAKAAVHSRVQKFIGLGSCIEYQMVETPLDVDSPLDPTTVYSGAKVAAFHALTQFFEQTDTAFLWCRLFYLFGEGEDSRRLVPFLHEKMRKGEVADLTSGNQIRDFMDVSEAAQRIVDLAQTGATGPANICTGQGQTVRALAEGIADGYKSPELLNFGARPDNLVDPPYVVGVPTLPKYS